MPSFWGAGSSSHHIESVLSENENGGEKKSRAGGLVWGKKEKERRKLVPRELLCEGVHVHLLLAEVPEHLDQRVREGVEVDVELAV